MNSISNECRLIRLKHVTEMQACGPTEAYARIKSKLLTPPIKRGRTSVWPFREIRTINAAIIAGKSDNEIRELVKQLVAARAQTVSQ